MIKDNMWNGKRCFIVGGGPSLKDFDWNLLENELWIGINAASLKKIPTIAYTHDLRVIKQIFMKKHKDYWLNLPCRVHKFKKHLPDGHIYGKNIFGFKESNKWTKSLSEGLFNGNNSGTTSLHLADLLGAKEIYLLGFDCKMSESGDQQFHKYYPDKWKQSKSVYFLFMKEFHKIKNKVRAKVYNCSLDSRLNCFEKISIHEVLKGKKDANNRI